MSTNHNAMCKKKKKKNTTLFKGYDWAGMMEEYLD